MIGAHLRSATRALRAYLAVHGPLAFACTALIVAGVALRIQQLGWPNFFTWDEHHFVENARNYINQRPDWNDHPPLGKLFIALGIRALGDSGAGWRAAGLVFGLLSILLGAKVARRLWKNPHAAWITAAILSADGFLIAYSRTALVDGTLTAFTLLTLLSSLLVTRWWHVPLVGVVVGCTAGVKVSGFSLGVPVALILIVRGLPWWSLAGLATALPVYLAICCTGLWLSHLPYGPMDGIEQTRALVAGHLKANEWKHPLTSRWYTWFVPTKPIMMSSDFVGPYRARVTSTLGNLAFWHTSALALLVCSALALRAAARRAFRFLATRSGFERPFLVESPAAAPALFWGAMMLPWLVSDRDSYMYHYLPSYAVGLVVLGGVCSVLYEKFRTAVLCYVLMAGVVFAYFAPVWGRLPISADALHARLGLWL